MDSVSKAVFQTGQIKHAIDWLQKKGIDPTCLLNAMSGDVASIDDLSRKLLPLALDHQSAHQRRERGRASKSTSRNPAAPLPQSRTLVRDDKHLPPSATGFLITLLIEACTRVGAVPPAALAQLVRVHLGANAYAAPKLKAPDAFDKAVRYKLAYPNARQEEIARHAGVTHPAVHRWIKDGSLDQAVERMRSQGLEDFIRKTTPRT
jgi:hypothetical protein